MTDQGDSFTRIEVLPYLVQSQFLWKGSSFHWSLQAGPQAPHFVRLCASSGEKTYSAAVTALPIPHLAILDKVALSNTTALVPVSH